jgi:hypothetical protein
VTIDNLNITSSLTLSGGATMNCTGGGGIGLSCFGITGACPSFASCFLAALGLNIGSTSNLTVPRLQVGIGVGDAGNEIVNLGAYPANPINTLTAYVSSLFQLSTIGTAMNLIAYSGNVNLQSVGGAGVTTEVQSQGTTTVQGTYGVGISSSNGNIQLLSGGTSLQVQGVSGVITATASNFTAFTTNWGFYRNPGDPYVASQNNQTLQCSAIGPLSVISGASSVFSHDLILAPGVKILTQNPSGLLGVVGLSLCGGLIVTEGTTLQLQNGTKTKTVDVRGTFTNAEGGFPITFVDTEGANFQDTPLYNGVGGVALEVSDPDGLAVLGTNATFFVGYVTPNANNTNVTFTNNTVVASSATLYVSTIEPVVGASGTTSFLGTVGVNNIAPHSGGTVTIQGNLYATGTISAGGSCCTSDRRVKEHIEPVAPRDDLEMLMSLPQRVRFRYNEAYRAVDSFLTDHVQHGFIAQELEAIMPHVVHMMNQTVAGVRHADFRKLSYERMVPHVVGAVRALHLDAVAQRARADALELENAVLRRAHNVLADAHRSLRRDVARIKRAIFGKRD